MSKDKLTQEEIYIFLCRQFPGRFSVLEKVPREIRHPGDQPSQPVRMIQKTISLNPGDSFSDLVRKFSETRLGSVERLSAYVHRPELKPGYYIGGDDDDYNHYLDEDENWVPATYGEPDRIDLSFLTENENFIQEQREYERKLKDWRHQIDNRRARLEEINQVNKRNADRIQKARNENQDLWREAGRALKGEGDAGWLQRKAEALRSELAAVENMLSLEENKEVEND